MATTNHLFQLTFPDEGWRETTVYTFEGPHDSGVQHNLVLTIDSNLPKKPNLVEWAKTSFGTTKEVMPGYEFISEKEIRLPNGVPGYEMVFRYSPTDELKMFQKQVFVIIEDKGYIFSSTFSKKTLQTIANEVDRIIASLKPIQEQE
jgi:hypothetical protein